MSNDKIMVQSNKPRILIVDDEPMNIELLAFNLMSDYEILSASDGYEALDIVSSELPDMVLLDVMMPGISGYQVCEQIKSSEKTKYMPVVLVTALYSEKDRLKGIEAKADDFLTKPVDRIELLMRVKSLLRIKKLQDNLLKERDQAQNYLDVAAVMILAVDLNNNITLINKRGLEILDSSEEEVLGKNLFREFIPKESNSAMMHIFKSSDTQNSINYNEFPIITKNGDQRFISWYSKPLMDGDGAIVGYICSGQDITKRKHVEEALKRQTSAMETSIDGMGIMDRNGVYTYVNNAYVTIFGYDSPDELIGKKWNLLYEAPEWSFYYDKVLPEFRQKGEWKGELQGRKKDGTVFFQEVSITALDDGVISVIRDITERKDVESRMNLYASQLKTSNELKDLFTDILRHDLLNPAGVIKGFTDILLNEESDENKKYKLGRIHYNASRLINMIESAAQFAKLEDLDELKFRSMDVLSILRNVIEEFEPQLKEKNISIVLRANGRYHASLNPVIDGVFSNFISNAIKYGPNDAEIIIDIQDAGDEWKVMVCDCGDGIPDKNKQLIFNRFNRLSSQKKAVKGSGLGLAIAKRTIELHGGRIGVDDNPQGKGSVFWATVKKA